MYTYIYIYHIHICATIVIGCHKKYIHPKFMDSNPHGHPHGNFVDRPATANGAKLVHGRALEVGQAEGFLDGR